MDHVSREKTNVAEPEPVELKFRPGAGITGISLINIYFSQFEGC